MGSTNAPSAHVSHELEIPPESAMPQVFKLSMLSWANHCQCCPLTKWTRRHPLKRCCHRSSLMDLPADMDMAQGPKPPDIHRCRISDIIQTSSDTAAQRPSSPSHLIPQNSELSHGKSVCFRTSLTSPTFCASFASTTLGTSFAPTTLGASLAPVSYVQISRPPPPPSPSPSPELTPAVRLSVLRCQSPSSLKIVTLSYGVPSSHVVMPMNLSCLNTWQA
jgi:hypothetical protein